MELVTVLAYLQSGSAKLMMSGLDWALNPSTLQIAGARLGVGLGPWLAEHAQIAMTGLILSLALELAFILYYPLPRLRKPLLWAAFGFHLGTAAALGIHFDHLWIFYLPVLVLAPALLGRLPPQRDTDLVAVIDGGCPICFASVRFILGFDERARFAVASFDSSAARSLGVKESSSEAAEILLLERGSKKVVARGPGAALILLREASLQGRIVAQMLAFFPDKVIEFVYAWVARRRRKLLTGGVNYESCELPPAIFKSRFLR